MSKPVTVISEWLPKEGHHQELAQYFKQLLALTKSKESGCLETEIFHQIQHPGAPGTSKFNIVLRQKYENYEAFDEHCKADYVKEFYDKHIEKLVKDWTCRLFKED